MGVIQRRTTVRHGGSSHAVLLRSLPGDGTMVFPLSCDVSQEELPVMMTAEDGIIRRLVEVKGVVVIRPLMTMTTVVILCHVGVG